MKLADKCLVLGTIGAVLIAIWASPGWAQNAPDNAIYANLLKSHVKDGHVDYQGFKNDEKRLDSYLAYLSKVDPESLTRNDQMAFYINAYNAWTIKLILDHYPQVTSIKEIGSFFQSPWKKKFVKLNHETVTLDYIEHTILRPLFKDPRVHFAINCAAKSCPPLLAEPYIGEQLEHQLNRVTQAFINDPQSTFMKENTLYVSAIFRWFRKDFGDNIIDFVKSYARGDLAKQLDAHPTPKVAYLTYDWSLNGV